MRRGGKTKEYEWMVQAFAEALDERLPNLLTEQQSRSNDRSRLATIYTPGGKLDGRVTIADVMDAAAIMGGISIGGMVASTGAVMITGDLGTFPFVWGWSNVGAAFVATARIILDVLDPAGFVEEIQEFRRFREEYDIFQEWRMEQRYGHPREVTHSATINMKEPDSRGWHRLGLEGEDLIHAARFARQYLGLKRQGIENLTAETHWVGKKKLFPDGKAGRADWQDFKSFWLGYEGRSLAVVVDGRGKWTFTRLGEMNLQALADLPLDIE